jgi:hypothetical protein
LKDNVLAFSECSASYIEASTKLLQFAPALIVKSALTPVKPRGTVLLIDPDLGLQHTIETEAAETDIAVIVASSEYQNPNVIHISQFLTQGQLGALFPPCIDQVFGCSSQKSLSVRKFLAQYRTVTMAEFFSLQPGMKQMPSSETWLATKFVKGTKSDPQ